MADAAPLDIKTHKDWVLTSLGEFCADKLREMGRETTENA